MPSSLRCPSSYTTDHHPPLTLEDGWPHGRVECRACSNFVTPRAAGTLRAHKQTARSTEYFRARKAALDDLRKEHV